MMKLDNIFSVLATKLFHYGQKPDYFVNNIKLLVLCLQIAVLGYTNTDGRCFITQNLILAIFKFYA